MLKAQGTPCEEEKVHKTLQVTILRAQLYMF